MQVKFINVWHHHLRIHADVELALKLIFFINDIIAFIICKFDSPVERFIYLVIFVTHNECMGLIFFDLLEERRHGQIFLDVHSYAKT